LSSNLKRYRIEKIGNLSLYEQYKILECLLEVGDRVLFHRFNTKLCEIKPRVLEKLKNEIFEEFCMGILYFYPENKKILYSNIKELLCLCKNKYKTVDTVDELLSKLLIQNEEIMSWVETDKIKLMVFEAFNFNNYDLDEIRWREERIVFENKYYLDEGGIKRSTSSSIWYCPLNCEEIIQSMKNEVQYSCIILNEKAKFSKYSYACHYEETAEDYDLLIFDKNERFYKNVIPKLLKLDKKIIESLKED